MWSWQISNPCYPLLFWSNLHHSKTVNDENTWWKQPPNTPITLPLISNEQEQSVLASQLALLPFIKKRVVQREENCVPNLKKGKELNGVGSMSPVPVHLMPCKRRLSSSEWGEAIWSLGSFFSSPSSFYFQQSWGEKGAASATLSQLEEDQGTN